MSNIALFVRNKCCMRPVTDAKRKSRYIPSTNSFCKMRGSMNGDEFVYPAKRKVYHRKISKHTRVMVADKKATWNLCQTLCTATKRKVIAQQCCASIVQQDEKNSKSSQSSGQFEMYLPRKKRPPPPTNEWKMWPLRKSQHGTEAMARKKQRSYWGWPTFYGQVSKAPTNVMHLYDASRRSITPETHTLVLSTLNYIFFVLFLFFL